jgi:polyhydroxyalkanoate synthesis regulator protein
MTKQNAQSKSAANDIQSLFDPQGYQEGFKTIAGINERMMANFVEAGNRSTDIASESAKESLSNMREAAQVRDEPAEYGAAYSEFVKKQTDLFMRTMQSYADVMQKAGSETTELASKAGKDIAEKARDNVEHVANTAGSAGKKAA